MKNKIKNTYLLFVIIFSGMGTAFYRSHEGLITLFFVTIFIMFYFKIPIKRKIIIAVVIWLVYSVFLLVDREAFTPFFIFRHLVYLLSSYAILLIFKEELFWKFENYIFARFFKINK